MSHDGEKHSPCITDLYIISNVQKKQFFNNILRIVPKAVYHITRFGCTSDFKYIFLVTSLLKYIKSLFLAPPFSIYHPNHLNFLCAGNNSIINMHLGIFSFYF